MVTLIWLADLEGMTKQVFGPFAVFHCHPKAVFPFARSFSLKSFEASQICLPFNA